MQSILQEGDREVREEDAEQFSEVGQGDIPSLLEDYRKSQFYEDGTASREGIPRFRKELVSAGERDKVKHLDILIEANQYYLLQREVEELFNRKKSGDTWQLEKRFGHLIENDELKIDEDTVNNIVGNFTEYQRTAKDVRTQDEKVPYYAVLDITGRAEDVKKRIDEVKKELFSTSLSDGVTNLRRDLDAGRSEERKKEDWNEWLNSAMSKANQNAVTFDGIIGMLMNLESPYNNRSSAVWQATRNYYLTGEEKEEDKLESVLERAYPNIRESFISSVSTVIEKIANLTDDELEDKGRIKDASKMKKFRQYVRDNFV